MKAAIVVTSINDCVSLIDGYQKNLELKFWKSSKMKGISRKKKKKPESTRNPER